jgi:hypothetical protein
LLIIYGEIKMLKKILLVCSVVMFSSLPSQAVVLPLVNGGFETPVTPDGTYTEGATIPDGWTVSQGNFWGGVQNPGYQTPDGEQNLWARLNNYSSGYESFTIYQNSTAAAVAGELYNVNFYVADTWLAGTTVTARLLIDNAAVSFVTVGTTDSFTGYATPDYLATAADAGKLLGVEIYATALGGPNDANFFLDAVSLNQVPDPATLLLFGVGGLMVIKNKFR